MGLDIHHYHIVDRADDTENISVPIGISDPTDPKETIDSLKELCDYAKKSQLLHIEDVEFIDFDVIFSSRNLNLDDWSWTADCEYKGKPCSQYNKSSDHDREWAKKPYWENGKGIVKGEDPNPTVTPEGLGRFGELVIFESDFLYKTLQCMVVYYSEREYGYQRKSMKSDFYKIYPPEFYITRKSDALMMAEYSEDKEYTIKCLKLDEWVDGVSFIKIDW